MYLQLLTLAF